MDKHRFNLSQTETIHDLKFKMKKKMLEKHCGISNLHVFAYDSSLF